MICKCLFSPACPVTICVKILSSFRPSVCACFAQLWFVSGRTNFVCLYSVELIHFSLCFAFDQFLINLLITLSETGSLGSSPSSGYYAPSFAKLSAIPLPSCPECPGLQLRVTLFVSFNLFKSLLHSVTLRYCVSYLYSDLIAPWLSMW